MTRQMFEGYGLTELREFARNLQIKGRSKMSGDELLAACRAAWAADRIAKENVVINGGEIKPGTLLSYASHPGCVIRVTSNIIQHPEYGSLYVEAEYVSMCADCANLWPAGIEYLNAAQRRDVANGLPAGKHMLYLLAHIPAYTPSPAVLAGLIAYEAALRDETNSLDMRIGARTVAVALVAAESGMVEPGVTDWITKWLGH